MKKKRHTNFLAIVKYILLSLVIASVLVPVIWVFSLAFRYPEEVYKIFPTKFTLQNFPIAIESVQGPIGLNIYRMFGNTALITIVSIIGVIIVGTLAAFAFSYYRFII